MVRLPGRVSWTGVRKEYMKLFLDGRVGPSIYARRCKCMKQSMVHDGKSQQASEGGPTQNRRQGHHFTTSQCLLLNIGPQ
jgi:hypothetical protein